MIYMDEWDIIEGLFKCKQIDLKTKEIENQERMANQSQGTNSQILQTIIASEKQTIEVIKLMSGCVSIVKSTTLDKVKVLSISSGS